MELQNRARSYARVAAYLFAQTGVKGELKTVRRGARHLSLGIRLSNPLRLEDALKLANPLALATQTPAVIAQRRADLPGLVTYQFELQHGYWQSYTRADVSGLGVGLGESRKQIDFSFEPAPHTLVAGSTGCGKSVTVASILAALCQAYTPADLRIILVDPDHDYDDLTNAANLALPIAHEPSEIDAALAWLDAELAGRKAGNVKDATRLLLVIDEAETILDHETRLAIVQAVATGGRKWQVHLLVATQKPKQAKLPDLINQLGSRYIGKCDNAQTSVLLTGHAGLGAHKLSDGGGDFLHLNGGVERLQVAMAMRADFDHLERAEVIWPDIEPLDSPRVLNFERGEPGRPVVEIDPRKVACYVHYGVDGISLSQAEALGLKRRAHERHKAFAVELIDELERLKENGA